MKLMIFSCFYIFFINFSKKLMVLLSMEFLMVLLIFSFFFSSKDYSFFLFSFFMIFLIVMVLDSVLGISLLIFSCRFSGKSSYKFL